MVRLTTPALSALILAAAAFDVDTALTTGAHGVSLAASTYGSYTVTMADIDVSTTPPSKVFA